MVVVVIIMMIRSSRAEPGPPARQIIGAGVLL